MVGRFFRRVWQLLGFGSAVHFAWYTMGGGAIVSGIGSALLAAWLDLPWWAVVSTFIGLFLLAVGLIGVALQVVAPHLEAHGIRLGTRDAEVIAGLRAQNADSLAERDEARREAQALKVRRLDRQTLGAFLTEGNRLRHEAWQALDVDGVTPTSPVAGEYDTKAQKWAGRVTDYLDRTQRGASDLFMDETPRGMQTKVYGREVRSNIGNWYDRRLMNLKALIAAPPD